MGKTDHNAHSVYQLGVNPPADIAFGRIAEGTVALANIFCWAAALLYAQMGAKSVVISPPSLINTVHSQTSLSACLISNCFVFNH